MPFDFEKLEVYKKAIDFANDIYNLTKKFPKDEQFGITSQKKNLNILRLWQELLFKNVSLY